jgi:hypothetical protein
MSTIKLFTIAARTSAALDTQTKSGGDPNDVEECSRDADDQSARP